MFKRCVAVFFFISVFALCSVMAQDKLYTNEFPLGNVTLLAGPFKTAQDLNTTHLLKYTVGRLLVSYRKDAGLATQGFSDYPNWDGLNGHVLGHYLSALSMQYAATGNATCKSRLDDIVTQMKACQDANASVANFTGYVSGIPDGKTCWNRVKSGDWNAVNSWWVPWYNIHKTYAGLRDAWVYGNNSTARTMFLALCDWGINICSALTDANIQSMLGQEHGGINEVYLDAYVLTNDTKYLNFARRMSHQTMLNAWAASNDNLDGVHANTQVAKCVGFQRIGEVAKDNTYYNAANFFWTRVAVNRAIAIGGNSEDESFRSAAQCTEYLTDRNGVEKCNTYNMLKLTEGLFRQNPLAKYTDFYERALFNDILSSQNPTHGGYVYFTPTHPRHYRVYSAPDVAMWCCVGSGMENHPKYGQFIYTHTPANDSLFVNLFIASQLNWAAKGVTIRQETVFPDSESTKLTITVSTPTAFKMYIRHPYWAATGEMVVTVGAQTFGASSQPTSYVEINRTWNNGDIVMVSMPMHWSYEQLINVTGWYALKRGPIVMGAKTDSTISNMPGLVADDSRFGHSPSGTLMDYTTAPKLRLNTNTAYIDRQFTPVAGQPLVYRAPGIFQNAADSNLVLKPFFRLHNVRYMMYWNATMYTGTRDEWRQKTPASFGIRQLKGAMKFSFTAADPSRHVLLYTLAGKRIADVPAPSRTVTLNYLKQGIRMTNGTYSVQVLSKGNQISKAIYITN
jgi:uncharacterized protein